VECVPNMSRVPRTGPALVQIGSRVRAREPRQCPRRGAGRVTQPWVAFRGHPRFSNSCRGGVADFPACGSSAVCHHFPTNRFVCATPSSSTDSENRAATTILSAAPLAKSHRVRLAAPAPKATARAGLPPSFPEYGDRPEAATTSAPLGPSLVNQSSDDVEAGTATVALLKSDSLGHPRAGPRRRRRRPPSFATARRLERPRRCGYRSQRRGAV
jgi:hypothetical protein